MREERVGYALCGSFCTHAAAVKALEALAAEYRTIVPVVSETVAGTDTRFGRAADLLAKLESITGRPALRSVQETEPFGPKGLLDILVIVPATGNTLAKLAAGIADTSVTMAAKAHLRNGRPVVLAVSSNDALAAGARNIGELLSRRHYYFVPLRQDSPGEKPTSLVADFSLLGQTVDAALRGKQIQPLLLGPESVG